MKRIRVMIVEDSRVVQEHLRRIIAADSRFEIAGIVGSGEEAVEQVDRLTPDVISMDIQLPGIEGFEATRQIMMRRPTPIIVVSGVRREDMSLTMKALKAGALSVVEKPVGSGHDSFDTIAAALRTQLAIMSEVKVVRRRSLASPKLAAPPPAIPLGADQSYKLLGIAASTGGPNAVVQVLSGLGPEFPLPVAIVQHITPGFVDGFAEWLSTVVPFRVLVVNEPITMAPGTVYVAPSHRHLAINGLLALLDDRPPDGSHRPSANVLFSTIAQSLGHCGMGVVLTGMGEDGAAGLRELRAAGGYTVAEDESTAIVYGMPAAAIQLGGASETFPIGEIAPRLVERTASRMRAN